MSDLVDRQQVIDAIDALHEQPNAWLEQAVEAVERLPSADPERKTGKWGKEGECPFCSYLRQWEDDKFCANCGARMVEDE